MGVAEGLPSSGISRDDRGSRRESLDRHDRRSGPTAATRACCSFTRKEGLPVDTVRAIFERPQRPRLGRHGRRRTCADRCPAPMQCRTKADGLPHGSGLRADRKPRRQPVGRHRRRRRRPLSRRKVRRDDRHAERRTAERSRARAGRDRGRKSVGQHLRAVSRSFATGTATRIKEFEDRQLRPLLALPDGSLLVGTDGAGLWRVSGDGSQRRRRRRGRPGAGERSRLQSGRWMRPAAASGSARRAADWRGSISPNGSVQTLTRHDGLHDDVVFQVVDAGRGADLWLTSNRGVYRVKRDRVLAAMPGSEGRSLRHRLRNDRTGCRPPNATARFPARCARATDGCGWRRRAAWR